MVYAQSPPIAEQRLYRQKGIAQPLGLALLATYGSWVKVSLLTLRAVDLLREFFTDPAPAEAFAAQRPGGCAGEFPWKPP
jgi:hypothetical protein